MRGRCKYVPVSGSRLLVCAFLRTRQDRVGRPAQPARGMPRAHAADTPHSDTAPPLTDSGGCWQVSTLVDTVDPRHAWMLFDSIRNIRFRWRFIHAWRGSTADRRDLSKAGWVRLRGVSRMDAATELTWVRALCLRSTASQAPERTAASGWAGPRRVLAAPPQPDPPRPPTGSQLLMLLRLLLLLQLAAGAGRSPADKPLLRRFVARATRTRLYTSRVTRLSRPQRLLLQLAVLATLLMVLAPLVSRALQAPPIDHAAMAGMDHAHMHHDAAVLGPSPLHGQRSPTPPADPTPCMAKPANTACWPCACCRGWRYWCCCCRCCGGRGWYSRGHSRYCRHRAGRHTPRVGHRAPPSSADFPVESAARRLTGRRARVRTWSCSDENDFPPRGRLRAPAGCPGLAVAATLVHAAPAEEARTLDTVVVTAAAPSSPLHWVTDPRLPRQPVPASDGADYLKTVPGFSAIRNGGTNGDPVLRGMLGSRLNILSNDGNLIGACPRAWTTRCPTSHRRASTA